MQKTTTSWRPSTPCGLCAGAPSGETLRSVPSSAAAHPVHDALDVVVHAVAVVLARAPVPEPAQRRAAGRDGHVSPAQLAERLRVHADEEGVGEDGVGRQADDLAVRERVRAGEEPLPLSVAQVAPGGQVEVGARLPRRQRLRVVRVDRRPHARDGGRVAPGVEGPDERVVKGDQVDRPGHRARRLLGVEAGEPLHEAGVDLDVLRRFERRYEVVAVLHVPAADPEAAKQLAQVRDERVAAGHAVVVARIPGRLIRAAHRRSWDVGVVEELRRAALRVPQPRRVGAQGPASGRGEERRRQRAVGAARELEQRPDRAVGRVLGEHAPGGEAEHGDPRLGGRQRGDPPVPQGAPDGQTRAERCEPLVRDRRGAEPVGGRARDLVLKVDARLQPEPADNAVRRVVVELRDPAPGRCAVAHVREPGLAVVRRTDVASAVGVEPAGAVGVEVEQRREPGRSGRGRRRVARVVNPGQRPADVHLFVVRLAERHRDPAEVLLLVGGVERLGEVRERAVLTGAERPFVVDRKRTAPRGQGFPSSSNAGTSSAT